MKNIFTPKHNINLNNKNGFTIIEVLIASVIISLISLAVMSAASKGIELSSRGIKQVQANMLIEEGIEAVKSIRDNDWDTIASLTLDTDYQLSFSSNLWSLAPATNPPTQIDNVFNRIIVFSEVNRDGSADIASSGTPDVGTKKVSVTVSWVSRGEVISKNINFYLADIFN